MGRPKKSGLEWYPVTVNMPEDDKMRLIEAVHGPLGFAVVMKLLSKIYGEGYCYEWTEENELLFAGRWGYDPVAVHEIVLCAVKRRFFDPEVFEKHGILTSERIQNNFLDAVSKRTNVTVREGIWLLKSNPEKKVQKSKPETRVSAADTTPGRRLSEQKPGVSAGNSTQSREEKSREKVTNVISPETIDAPSPDDAYQLVIEASQKFGKANTPQARVHCGELVWQAVKEVGWSEICQSKPGDQFFKSRFTAKYGALVGSGPRIEILPETKLEEVAPND